MLSMSGFAVGCQKINSSRYMVEMKSVNHRFLDLHFKWPRYYARWEEKLANEVRKVVGRGRIDIWVNVEKNPLQQLFSKENLQSAKAYVDGIKKLQKLLHLDGAVDLALLTRFLEENTGANLTAIDRDFEWFSKLFVKVLKRLKAMKAREGAYLRKDLQVHQALIVQLLKTVKRESATALKDLPQKMAARLQEQLKGKEIDIHRLNQEISFFMERTDVNEELIRIDSHMSQFNLFLQEDPVEGKKIEFLLQELQREFNTLTVKIKSAEISHLVVRIKSELEKMKEQILNVE
jgi:uncharacterized protein (TIGR00255 family)